VVDVVVHQLLDIKSRIRIHRIHSYSTLYLVSPTPAISVGDSCGW